MTWPSVAKLAFAHYFTPYPISFTSGATNYTSFLPPGNSSTAAYGGLLRDQPIPRAATSDPNWAVVDMETEIRNAKAVGVDGFTVDILNTSYTGTGADGAHWVKQDNLMAAADALGNFSIIPMFDMGTYASFSLESTLVSRMKTLAGHPSCFTIGGKLVLSAFHAENWTPTQWNTAIAGIESATGKTVAFVPCFLTQTNAQIDAFLAVTRIYGASVWGNRSPAGQTNMAALAAHAHAQGLIWMGPVSVQDERPNQAIYDEAVNTHNLEASWAAACGYPGDFTGTAVTNGVSDWVQIPTWNDFSEGAQLCPSTKHGWAYAIASQYYCGLWKAGLTPTTAATPTQDTLVLTHRTHNHNATVTGETSVMARRANTSTASNLVEVWSLSSATSTLSLNVGGSVTSTTAPAGLSRFTAALASGVISATRTRSGVPDLTVQTPSPASTPVTSVAIQDEQYIAAIAQSAPASAATVLFGVTDAASPASFFDTLEGAYSGGSGSGCGVRIPIVHVADGWTAGMAAFGAATRELNLFNAGHAVVVSIGLPTGATPYTDITSGTYDAVLTTLGTHINALSFSAAVSGAQAGQAYGGTTAASVRLAFFPQMDADSTHGTVAQKQAGYRYVCAKVAAQLSARSKVSFVWAPSGGAAANGNATLNLPGLTAADFVDEIGVQFPVSSSAYTNFTADIAPWENWRAANAPTRKFIPIKIAVHVDAGDSTHQGTYLQQIEARVQAHPEIYSGAIWDALPTGTIDDRNPAKSNSSLLFTAFVGAVVAAVAAGGKSPDVTPPPTPTGLTVTAQTTTTCTVTWAQASVPDLAGFQIALDGVVVTTTATPAVLTYTFTGLVAATTHTPQVASVDTTGNVSVYAALQPAATFTQPGIGQPLPPVISASVAMTNSTGIAALTAADPASGQLVATWDWGDGGPTDSGTAPTHIWATPGGYNVTVTVLSLASNLSSIQIIPVTATLPTSAVTPNLSLVLPAVGGDPGEFGASLRADLIAIDTAAAPLVNGQGTPTAAAVAGSSGAGTSPPAPVIAAGSTDNAGSVTFGTGSSTTGTGAYLTVTFATPKQAAPVVVIAAGNQATGVLDPYIVSATVATTGFQVALGAAGAASQSNTVYAVSWLAVGS